MQHFQYFVVEGPNRKKKKLGDNLNKKTKNVYIIARLTANANFGTVPAGFNPASSYTYFGIADGRR